MRDAFFMLFLKGVIQCRDELLQKKQSKEEPFEI